jgi:nicotinamidase-related amidase
MSSIDRAALLIIDVQRGFEDEKWGERNNLEAEDRMEKLLAAWREKGYPVIYIQHAARNKNSPLHPDQAGFAFKEKIQPIAGETIIQKRVNSAFIGTQLEDHLRRNDIDTLVITGLTTPHCVSTTTRMSGNLGFNTYLVSDATAAFGLTGPDGLYYSAETIHAVSLAVLHEEFAAVVTTEDILTKIGAGDKNSRFQIDGEKEHIQT